MKNSATKPARIIAAFALAMLTMLAVGLAVVLRFQEHIDLAVWMLITAFILANTSLLVSSLD